MAAAIKLGGYRGGSSAEKRKIKRPAAALFFLSLALLPPSLAPLDPPKSGGDGCLFVEVLAAHTPLDRLR